MLPKKDGVVSQGMVLCAGNDDRTAVEFVVPAAGAKPGDRVVLADGSVTVATKVDDEVLCIFEGQGEGEAGGGGGEAGRGGENATDESVRCVCGVLLPRPHFPSADI